ncbi:hypothetical protein RGAI101_83 [Roseobacter sp. GAI101]|nr:hypothetical protein RGAI101_83 [Roseobacter sp. GAI101]
MLNCSMGADGGHNKTWYEFLDDFVDDTDLVTRIKAKSPR